MEQDRPITVPLPCTLLRPTLSEMAQKIQ